MTDRFKEAFDWCAKMRVLADSILADSCFTAPLDTIEKALTLATEAEQLRKERDELASALNEYYIMYGDRSIISRVDDLLEKAGILND